MKPVSNHSWLHSHCSTACCGWRNLLKVHIVILNMGQVLTLWFSRQKIKGMYTLMARQMTDPSYCKCMVPDHHWSHSDCVHQSTGLTLWFEENSLHWEKLLFWFIFGSNNNWTLSVLIASCFSKHLKSVIQRIFTLLFVDNTPLSGVWSVTWHI